MHIFIIYIFTHNMYANIKLYKYKQKFDFTFAFVIDDL